jgi:hypothetical protein
MGTITTNFPIAISGHTASFDAGDVGATKSAVQMTTTMGNIQLRRED